MIISIKRLEDDELSKLWIENDDVNFIIMIIIVDEHIHEKRLLKN
jgi:hypothetical protein